MNFPLHSMPREENDRRSGGREFRHSGGACPSAFPFPLHRARQTQEQVSRNDSFQGYSMNSSSIGRFVKNSWCPGRFDFAVSLPGPVSATSFRDWLEVYKTYPALVNRYFTGGELPAHREGSGSFCSNFEAIYNGILCAVSYEGLFKIH